MKQGEKQKEYYVIASQQERPRRSSELASEVCRKRKKEPCECELEMGVGDEGGTQSREISKCETRIPV